VQGILKTEIKTKLSLNKVFDDLRLSNKFVFAKYTQSNSSYWGKIFKSFSKQDIELIEQILADLRQGQNHTAINKQYTPVGGSLTEEI
jgi:hypothetical protein